MLTDEKKREYQREYMKEYRRTHKEQLAAIKKRWAEKNRDKIREYRKQYDKEHRGEIKKRQRELEELKNDPVAYRDQGGRLVSYEKVDRGMVMALYRAGWSVVSISCEARTTEDVVKRVIDEDA